MKNIFMYIIVFLMLVGIIGFGIYAKEANKKEDSNANITEISKKNHTKTKKKNQTIIIKSKSKIITVK